MNEERVVVVTGAAGGLGSQVLRRLSSRGARVAAVDLDEKRLRSVIKQSGGAGQLEPLAGDVTDDKSVRAFIQRAVDKWGRLDAIFNNAAIQGLVGPFLDYPEDELWKVIRTNFFSAWLGMKYAIPHMKAAGGGVILNTGSSLAFRGWKEVPAYVSAKHALAGLTKTIAIEHAPDNIRANLLCPSSMDTPMLDPVAASLGGGNLEEGHRRIRDMIPSGRVAPPAEVAEVAVWMLLDAPPHVSGILLPVDAAENAG